MDPLIAKAPPVGYWIEDGRGKWIGPFETDQMAVDTALRKRKAKVAYWRLA